MRYYARIIALLLVLLIAFSAFAACDSGSNENTKQTEADSVKENVDTDETLNESETLDEDATNESDASETVLSTETETEMAPVIEEKDYDSDFFLLIHPDSNPFSYYWVKESDNDALSQAIYDRQQRVSKQIGVDVYATASAKASGYVEPFKNAVKNKDGSVDSLLTHVYIGIDGFITGNYLTDLQDVPGINLKADYWKLDVMEQISLNDRMYLGYNNFNIMYTHVVAFNKDLMDKYSDSIDESVYDMVKNYHWTLDRMIGLANMVYVDNQSNGKSRDDTFGIVGLHDIAFCGFLHSSNIDLVEQNDKGDYTLAIYNDINREKTVDVVEKLAELVKSDCAWFWRMRSGMDVNFVDGTSLLVLETTNALPNFLNYDINFGVLPYPMYDEQQKSVGYRSLQWGGYMCVPAYVENIDMVGDTLEALAFFSDEVNNTFYEKLLGKQVAETVVDKEMLKIVWDGICSDFCQTYYNALIDTQALYIVTYLTFDDAEYNVASYIASMEIAVNKKLKKFLAAAKLQ